MKIGVKMEASFWHARWKGNDIAFHQATANPFLVRYLHKLTLPKGARIFLPLCGKTLDISYLLAQGYRVVGAELSELAIQQLFAEFNVEPKVTEYSNLKSYSSNNVEIFVGDIFKLDEETLGEVDAVYDRAALVALPAAMREQYTHHIQTITQQAPQLLICFEYDQSVLNGPPFSVSHEEVQQHYAATYSLKLLETADVEGGLKGKCPAQEHIFLLKDKK